MPIVSFTTEVTLGHLIILGVTAGGFWLTRRAFGRLDGRLNALEKELRHR